MIEAVKSTVASNALLKGNVDQSSTLNSFAANPDKVQNVSQAPYVSPTVRVDVNTKIAILEFRESLSGQVLAQIPSEQAIRSYKLRQAKEDAQLAVQLTEKVGTQNGAAPTETPVQAAEVSPVQSTSSDAAPSDPHVSVAVQLDAITTQLDI
jgi:hypothetical protein